MSTYLTFGNYTSQGMAGLISPDAGDRTSVMKAVCDSVGAKLIEYQVTRGIYDFFVITEADSFDQVAAVILKVSASGAVENIQTLEVVDLETIQSIANGVAYTPPGG